ncbi:uncharacterized protein [Patagioenas fasciata]|uniref:uncharacterized protein n=1 Tax=Patagioenas fasciata TaxID=372321 RepID=UPI003A99CCA7
MPVVSPAASERLTEPDTRARGLAGGEAGAPGRAGRRRPRVHHGSPAPVAKLDRAWHPCFAPPFPHPHPSLTLTLPLYPLGSALRRRDRGEPRPHRDRRAPREDPAPVGGGGLYLSASVPAANSAGRRGFMPAAEAAPPAPVGCVSAVTACPPARSPEAGLALQRAPPPAGERGRLRPPPPHTRPAALSRVGPTARLAAPAAPPALGSASRKRPAGQKHRFYLQRTSAEMSYLQ